MRLTCVRALRTSSWYGVIQLNTTVPFYLYHMTVNTGGIKIKKWWSTDRLNFADR